MGDSVRQRRSQKGSTLSVVVPTYDEWMNVDSLCKRLFAATRNAGIDAELLLVDDHSKGTQKTVDEVARLKKEGYPISIYARPKTAPRGLGPAVVDGLERAKHDTLLVMDADLQHEPESVPAIAQPVLSGQAEFSIGSRNVEGAQVSETWGLHRKIISGGATALALPLATCSDPMSGFFCLSRAAYMRAASAGLNPMGYKIGLELMVKARCNDVSEIPITFKDREAGESKLTMTQNILYVRHLCHLYWFRYPAAVFVVVVLILLSLYVMFALLGDLVF